MGIESSIPKDLASKLDEGEIQRLAKRFRKLDVNKSGTITKDEIMSLPEIQKNVLAERIFDLFDTDGDGEVDFKEFVEGMSQFSVEEEKTTKLGFAFRIYDLDNDGFISREDLFKVLQMMIKGKLENTQLEQLVNRTFLQLGKDKDGLISFEDFLEKLGNTNVHESMVVKI